MALTDIKKRILQDAQKESAKLIRQAEERRDEALTEQEKAFKHNIKQLEKKTAVAEDRRLAQYHEQFALDSRQELLAEKRRWLDRFFQELKADILKDKKKSAKIFQKMLRAARPDQGVFFASAHTAPALTDALQALDIELSVDHAPLADGVVRLETHNSVIDFSLDQYLQELQNTRELTVLTALLAK